MLPLTRTRRRTAPRSSGQRIRTAFTALTILFGLPQAGTPSAALAASDKPDIRTLQQAADQMNTVLPAMLDGDTRLERVSAGEGQLRYHATVVSYAASELDLDHFRQVMTDQLRADACQAPSTQPFLNAGITLIYEYRDKNGGHLGEFAVSPATCG